MRPCNSFWKKHSTLHEKSSHDAQQAGGLLEVDGFGCEKIASQKHSKHANAEASRELDQLRAEIERLRRAKERVDMERRKRLASGLSTAESVFDDVPIKKTKSKKAAGEKKTNKKKIVQNDAASAGAGGA